MDDELQCPHCGNDAVIVMDNPSSLPWEDDQQEDIECKSCKRDLTVKCKVTRIEWVFIDDDGEDIEFQE